MKWNYGILLHKTAAKEFKEGVQVQVLKVAEHSFNMRLSLTVMILMQRTQQTWCQHSTDFISFNVKWI